MKPTCSFFHMCSRKWTPTKWQYLPAAAFCCQVSAHCLLNGIVLDLYGRRLPNGTQPSTACMLWPAISWCMQACLFSCHIEANVRSYCIRAWDPTWLAPYYVRPCGIASTACWQFLAVLAQVVPLGACTLGHCGAWPSRPRSHARACISSAACHFDFHIVALA